MSCVLKHCGGWVIVCQADHGRVGAIVSLRPGIREQCFLVILSIAGYIYIGIGFPPVFDSSRLIHTLNLAGICQVGEKTLTVVE